MHFLIDASLPRSTADLIRRAGHEATDVRDLGAAPATDPQVAQIAQGSGRALITGDFDFADIRIYPPEKYHGIAVIERPENATVAQVLQMVSRLLSDPRILGALPGRLAIVDRYRIRLRPAVE